MSGSITTQTTPEEGTRTIATQTGHHGTWEIQSRVGAVIGTGPYKPATAGPVVKGRGCSTSTPKVRAVKTQTIWRQPAKRIPDWFVLREVTDDNILNWTPGEGHIKKRK